MDTERLTSDERAFVEALSKLSPKEQARKIFGLLNGPDHSLNELDVLAAALRRAHAAGKREAVEECAQFLDAGAETTAANGSAHTAGVLSGAASSVRRALAAGAGEEEGEG